MDTTIPVLAGAVSTVIFASSTLPMLVKAARTKDLSSYSLGNILLANLGNLVHSIYVFQLPAGPIWALHLPPGEHRADAGLVPALHRITHPPAPARIGPFFRRHGLGRGLASWHEAARPSDARR